MILPIRHARTTGPTDGIGGGDSKSRTWRPVSPGSAHDAKRLKLSRATTVQSPRTRYARLARP